MKEGRKNYEKKEIEKISWMAEQNEHIIAVSKIITIKNEEILIIDVADAVPRIRICLSKKEYANYIPNGSKEGNGGTWNSKLLKSFCFYRYNVNIDTESIENIKTFLGWSGKDWIYKILSFENEINNKKRDLIQTRREEKCKIRMQTVPEVHIDFKYWAHTQLQNHKITILPFRGNRYTQAICSACGQEHTFRKGEIHPKEIINCPNCSVKATVKRFDWLNKNPWPVDYVKKEVLILQRTVEGYVERHILIEKLIEIKSEKVFTIEIGRKFLINDNIYTYYHKRSLLGFLFWDDKNLSGLYQIKLNPGPLYTDNITDDMFKGTKYQYCALNYMLGEPNLSPIHYLQKYANLPEIELLAKSGLKKLALEIEPKDIQKGKYPWDKLGINSNNYKLLQKINGGRLELQWMQHESQIKSTVIYFFSKHQLSIERLMFIKNQMSSQKIMNYLIKQSQYQSSNKNIMDLIGIWEDYLSMAKRLHLNLNHEMIYKPKNLIQSHNMLVELCKGVEIKERVKELLKVYPDINKICREIKDKYTYYDNHYAIIVPDSAEHIIREGVKLGHCVDSSDIYFDRIQNRESYIVFLRKQEELETPYYTLEIEPNGVIRQKRTIGNNQFPDIQKAKGFLRKWQNMIQKNLTLDDFKLAKKSEIFRDLNLKQLRNKQVKIHNGHLIGKLLADVLEADLMDIK